MDRTNIFASHDDRRIMGWFDYDATRAEWSDLDCDGNGSLGTGRGTGIILTAGGKWVSSRITRWQGETPTFAYVTPEQAREWLLRNNEDKAIEEHFGEIPEEEDRRGGRPEIGSAVHVRLGELAGRVDEYAAFQDGTSRSTKSTMSRAEAIRQLIKIGLEHA